MSLPINRHYTPRPDSHTDALATVVYGGKSYAVTLLTGPGGRPIPLSDSGTKDKVATLIGNLLKAHEIRDLSARTRTLTGMTSQGLHFQGEYRPSAHNFTINEQSPELAQNLVSLAPELFIPTGSGFTGLTSAAISAQNVWDTVQELISPSSSDPALLGSPLGEVLTGSTHSSSSSTSSTSIDPSPFSYSLPDLPTPHHRRHILASPHLQTSSPTEFSTPTLFPQPSSLFSSSSASALLSNTSSSSTSTSTVSSGSSHSRTAGMPPLNTHDVYPSSYKDPFSGSSFALNLIPSTTQSSSSSSSTSTLASSTPVPLTLSPDPFVQSSDLLLPTITKPPTLTPPPSPPSSSDQDVITILPAEPITSSPLSSSLPLEPLTQSSLFTPLSRAIQREPTEPTRQPIPTARPLSTAIGNHEKPSVKRRILLNIQASQQGSAEKTYLKTNPKTTALKELSKYPAPEGELPLQAEKIHQCFLRNKDIPNRASNLMQALAAFLKTSYDRDLLTQYYNQIVPKTHRKKIWEDPENWAQAIIAYIDNQ